LRKARPQFIHGRQVIEIGRTQSTQLRTFTVSAGGVFGVFAIWLIDSKSLYDLITTTAGFFRSCFGFDFDMAS
jgi:hypothetical protein